MSNYVTYAVYGASREKCAGALRAAGLDPTEIGFNSLYDQSADDKGYLGVVVYDMYNGYGGDPTQQPSDEQKVEVHAMWDALPPEARAIIGEPRYIFVSRID